MSKSVSNLPSSSSDSPSNSWGWGLVISNDIKDRLFGRIMELIEVLSLSEKQEKSIKSLLGDTIHNVFQEAITLKPETHTELRNKYYKLMESRGNITPGGETV